jgi:hypothetical protein
MMAKFTVNAFYVTVLEEGLYGITDETIRPEPMVILINGDHTSHYWPKRELIIRFRVVKESLERSHEQ